MKLTTLDIVFCTLLVQFCLPLLAGIKPTKLTCEYRENPPVVDVEQPRLSWINLADEGERDQVQTARQVRVAGSREKLEEADLWDSEKVPGNTSIRVRYQGTPLKSMQDCWWQVRVWDKDDQVSEWSEPATWHMGLLKESDWKATWIGAPWQGEETLPKPTNPGVPLPEELPPPAPMFRKEFKVEKEIERAMVYVTGLGYFEFYLNGEKIGNDVLVPNQTNCGKRPELNRQNIPLEDDFREYKVMYLAYDVTPNVRLGINAAGSILGNGFYNPAKYWADEYGTPRFLAQIHLRYSDGTEEIVVSDQSWKASKSPILMDMVYYGEHYDARLEQEGWNKAGFDDSQWANAVKRKAPEGKRVAHTAYPDRVVERLQPIYIEKLHDGRFLVDFGQEVSGWVRLKNLEGPAGQKIEINYLSNTYSGDNSYIFKGGGKETYAARFNWFVFRKVEILNWPGDLHPEQIEAEVVNTYIEESASFETSNPLINRINHIWKRTQTANMHGGIVSDCPHRERSGYTGDGQVACATAMHNFDAKNFYYKWIRDIIGAQVVSTGYVPNGAPWQSGCGGGVAWGAAISIIPWEFFVQYGDLDILQEAYEPMKGYIDYMQQWVDREGIMHSRRTGKDGNVLKWFNLGDWSVPAEMPPADLVHTFYFWMCADLTAKTARALGKTEEASEYDELAERTRHAFHTRFFSQDEGSYGNAGANIFALKMGVPDEQVERVIKSLRKNIKSNEGHLDTGIFGTRYFFEVLAEHGMNDLAYEAMIKTVEPSYGRWLALGATTFWEKWDIGGSHNHPMFGGGLVWLFRNLAGMQADSERPGYRKIEFRPQIVEDLAFVSYFNETPYGKAGIRWENGDTGLSVHITVPVGCTATLALPGPDRGTITEGSTPLPQSGITILSAEDGETTVQVGSGKYRFVCN